MTSPVMDYVILDQGMAIDSLTLSIFKNPESCKSNGCGTGWFSRILCEATQWALGIEPGVLDKVWLYHDLGYSIPPVQRSAEHKLLVDSLAQYNIYVALKNTRHSSRHIFGPMIHTVLVWKGNAAYWEGVPGYVYQVHRFISSSTKNTAQAE